MDPKSTLHMTRWTVTSGSNANSRGAVVISAGDHQWQASADGNGAVEAPRVGEPGVGVCEGGVAGPAEGQLAGVGLLGGGFCLFA